MLTACREDKEDLNFFVTNVQSMQQVKIKPIPIMKTYETFLYAASELRDPFVKTVIDIPLRKNIKKDVIDDGIYPEARRLKEELEAYDLAELRFVGTLKQENLWVLIQSPEGIIYRVKKGNYMGKNEGQIIMISDTDLLLSEIVANDEGSGYIKRESSLSLINEE